jgi:hypothetical protein
MKVKPGRSLMSATPPFSSTTSSLSQRAPHSSSSSMAHMTTPPKMSTLIFQMRFSRSAVKTLCFRSTSPAFMRHSAKELTHLAQIVRTSRTGHRTTTAAMVAQTTASLARRSPTSAASKIVNASTARTSTASSREHLAPAPKQTMSVTSTTS